MRIRDHETTRHEQPKLFEGGFETFSEYQDQRLIKHTNRFLDVIKYRTWQGRNFLLAQCEALFHIWLIRGTYTVRSDKNW